MIKFLEVVDAEQGFGRLDENGRVRLIREILPFVIARYGISPQCLHPDRPGELTSERPRFSPDYYLEHALNEGNS